MNEDFIPYDDRPYRPCVGIFLLNNKSQVFAGRRIDSRAEAWQMPQGGIDMGESPIEACMREMLEEIGTNYARLITEHDNWLYYDIPLPLADHLWQGQYKGQKQKWMALNFIGIDADININTNEPEFCEWKWLSPNDLIDLAVPFKREVYKNVISTFQHCLK
jgi:putative (di)nucleoside polyphosphate hydrolase